MKNNLDIQNQLKTIENGPEWLLRGIVGYCNDKYAQPQKAFDPVEFESESFGSRLADTLHFFFDKKAPKFYYEYCGWVKGGLNDWRLEHGEDALFELIYIYWDLVNSGDISVNAADGLESYLKQPEIFAQFSKETRENLPNFLNIFKQLREHQEVEAIEWIKTRSAAAGFSDLKARYVSGEDNFVFQSFKDKKYHGSNEFRDEVSAAIDFIARRSLKEADVFVCAFLNSPVMDLYIKHGNSTEEIFHIVSKIMAKHIRRSEENLDFSYPEVLWGKEDGFPKHDGLACNRVIRSFKAGLVGFSGGMKEQFINIFFNSSFFSRMIKVQPTTAASFIVDEVLPIIPESERSAFIRANQSIYKTLESMAKHKKCGGRYLEFISSLLTEAHGDDLFFILEEMVEKSDASVAQHVEAEGVLWEANADLGQPPKMRLDPRSLRGYFTHVANQTMRAGEYANEPVRAISFLADRLILNPAVEVMKSKDSNAAWQYFAGLSFDLLLYSKKKGVNNSWTFSDSVIRHNIDDASGLAKFIEGLSRRLGGAGDEDLMSFFNSDGMMELAEKSPNAFAGFYFPMVKKFKNDPSWQSCEKAILASVSFEVLKRSAPNVARSILKPKSETAFAVSSGPA